MLEITSIGYMILLIEIMVVSGALGGMVSALLNWRDDQPFLSLILKHTLTGIVMALTVPLILNMFSSDLLDAGQAKPLRLFILGGLCIFVAFFSTGVLEKIYKSRLKSKDQDHQTGKQSSGKEENIDTAATMHGPEEAKLSEKQLKILEVLAGVDGAKLTIADLLRHTRISQKDFDEAVSLMKAKGLVVQELSGSKMPQLILTTRGRQQVLIEFPLRVGHY